MIFACLSAAWTRRDTLARGGGRRIWYTWGHAGFLRTLADQSRGSLLVVFNDSRVSDHEVDCSIIDYDLGSLLAALAQAIWITIDFP